MTASRWHYVRELSEQLRINGVPESQVRDIVAQVEGHAAATGEDLVSTFGQPVDYAAQWRRLTPRRWLGQVLLGAPVALGVTSGVLALFANQPWAGRVPVAGSDAVQFGVLFCVFGLMPWTAGLIESRRRASRLGEARLPSPWPLRIAVVLAFGTTVAVLSWVLDGWATFTVLVEVPRWLLAVLALVGTCALVFMGPAPNSSSQPVAAPWAPHHPWRSRIRRAFTNR